MNSATSVNAPRELTICGEPFTVSALTRNEWGAVQAYLLDHAKDPAVAVLESLNRAKAAGVEVSAEDRRAFVAEAMAAAKVWPPKPGSAAWFDLLDQVDGAAAVFLKTVLRKHQPGIADADVARLNEGATDEESRAVVHRALGVVPVPKAETPAEEAPGTASTTGPPSTTSSSGSAGSATETSGT